MAKQKNTTNQEAEMVARIEQSEVVKTKQPVTKIYTSKKDVPFYKIAVNDDAPITGTMKPGVMYKIEGQIKTDTNIFYKTAQGYVRNSNDITIVTI